MKYLYEAEFADGSTFRQPEDDSSRLKPGERSATFDFLEHRRGRVMTTFTLRGPRKVIIDHVLSRFVVDGKEYAPGGWLPNACAWVELEKDEHLHGPYFRRVQRTFQAQPDGSPREVGVKTQFCAGIPGQKFYIGVT